MGKLKMMAPRLATVPPRIRRLTDDSGHAGDHWRKWYGTSRWKQLRWSILVRDHFTCQCGCGVTLGHQTHLLVADHKEPHRGDERLFWDPQNLQTLRKSPCHDAKKQREEQGRG